MTNHVAMGYLRSESQADAEELAEASTAERIAMGVLKRLRAILLGQALAGWRWRWRKCRILKRIGID